MSIPSEITFGEVSIPSEINFGPAPDIGPVSFGPAPSISVTIPDSMDLNVDWGTIPIITITPTHIDPIHVNVTFDPMPPIPPILISFTGDAIPVNVDWGIIPPVGVVWGPTPTIDPIQFGPANISPVQFGPANISPVQFGPAPPLTVTWGPTPTLECNVTVTCPNSAMAAQSNKNFTEEDFVDDFESMEIETEGIGIPSEIIIRAPKFPEIKIQHDIPEFIELKAPDSIDLNVKLESNLPKSIELNSSKLPKSIQLLTNGLEKGILLDSSNVSIKLEMPMELPKLQIDTSKLSEGIPVTGIPDSIQVNMPSEITAKFELPKDLEVPLVFKGDPIPLKLDTSSFNDDDDGPCFRLQPCGKN